MLASTIMRDAHRAGIATDLLTPLGSLRRYSPDIGDVSLLGVAPLAEHPRVFDTFTGLSAVSEVLSVSPSHVTGATDRGIVTLHLTAPEQAGAELVGHPG